MKKIYLTAIVFLSIIILGCDTNKNCSDCNGGTTATVEILEAPTVLLGNIDSLYSYRIRSSGGVGGVFCSVESVSRQSLSVFYLLDDGDSDSLGNDPPYASSTSGDLVPNNGIFSRSINGRIFANGDTGTYIFVFRADSWVSEQKSIQIQVVNSSACEMISYPQTQTFAECFAPQNLELQVRPGAQDHIDTVRISLIDGISILKTADFSALNGDSLWSLNLTPQFFQCVGTSNDYILNYQAKTRFGFVCNQTVTGVSYTNMTPIVSNSVMADTAYRPVDPNDSTIIIITVDFFDCEMSGAGTNLNHRMQFDVARDVMEHWQSDATFFLRDDGIAPDTVAGNDRYSSFLKLTNNGLTDNLYYFRFYYIDCAPPNTQSEYLIDSIRVIQPGALKGGGLSDASELGISFPKTFLQHD